MLKIPHLNLRSNRKPLKTNLIKPLPKMTTSNVWRNKEINSVDSCRRRIARDSSTWVYCRLRNVTSSNRLRIWNDRSMLWRRRIRFWGTGRFRVSPLPIYYLPITQIILTILHTLLPIIMQLYTPLQIYPSTLHHPRQTYSPSLTGKEKMTRRLSGEIPMRLTTNTTISPRSKQKPIDFESSNHYPLKLWHIALLLKYPPHPMRRTCPFLNTCSSRISLSPPLHQSNLANKFHGKLFPWEVHQT